MITKINLSSSPRKTHKNNFNFHILKHENEYTVGDPTSTRDKIFQ